jgi:hypothetical protein
LDNAVGRTDSPALASVLTAERWTDRQLGRSEMLSLANHAVWLLTGNNPGLSMELARRSVRIRIAPAVDRPWQRQGFRHPDLLAWATENRPALVRAAITLVRAWLAAGRPAHGRKLGSFEGWSEVLGGVLEVAGVGGFLGNLDRLYEEADAEGHMWREFVAAWWDQHGDKPVRCSDLNALCAERGLMEEARGPGMDRSQQTKLAAALKGAKDHLRRLPGQHRAGPPAAQPELRVGALSRIQPGEPTDAGGDFNGTYYGTYGTSTGPRSRL